MISARNSASCAMKVSLYSSISSLIGSSIPASVMGFVVEPAAYHGRPELLGDA